MSEFDLALKVVRDDEHYEQFRWLLLVDDEEARGRHHVHEMSDCAFDTWADALNAGTVALARAEGQSYENEAADPVGDADCAAEASYAATTKAPAAYVSRDDLRKGAKGEAGGTQPGQTSNRYGTPLQKPPAKR